MNNLKNVLFMMILSICSTLSPHRNDCRLVPDDICKIVNRVFGFGYQQDVCISAIAGILQHADKPNNPRVKNIALLFCRLSVHKGEEEAFDQISAKLKEAHCSKYRFQLVLDYVKKNESFFKTKTLNELDQFFGNKTAKDLPHYNPILDIDRMEPVRVVLGENSARIASANEGPELEEWLNLLPAGLLDL